MSALLDEVEATAAPRALVTTATGKIWSNGLDLDWMGANVAQIEPFMLTVHELFARFLGSNVPAVAALQGHTFAAWRDARARSRSARDACRPWLLLSAGGGHSDSVDAGHDRASDVPNPEANRSRGDDDRPPLRLCIDAAASGLVDEAVDDDQVLSAALERARPLAAKDPATLAAIKGGMYASS